MKKLNVLLPMILLALLLACPAFAEPAEDLTPGVTVKVSDTASGKKASRDHLTDGLYTTSWESTKRMEPYVVLSSEKPVYGLYLCFRYLPESFVIQKESGDGWETVLTGDSRFYHSFYELNGLKKIRILSTADKKNALGLTEIFCFGKGEVPDWVQRWQPTEEKADVLFLVAHPDDELIFLGGAIPTYALEKNARVVVAYMATANSPVRRSEALNGLWSMGIRTYPVFGPISDHYVNTGKLKDEYKATTGGRSAVQQWITELYRKYQPEVVVTHDLKGEYGHPQHMMAADSAIACCDLSADAEKFPESAAEYGTWQIKKLYIHLYGEEDTQTVLDWEQPLAAAGGKTGTELASGAYALHLSQSNAGMKIRGKHVHFTVEETGGVMYPNTRFGLYRSEVGEDELKNDFLEHIVTAPAEPRDEGTEPEPEAPGQEEPAGEEPEAETPAAGTEPEEEADGTEVAEVLPEEDAPEAEETAPETVKAPEGTASGTDYSAPAEAPEWADVRLNARGYLDEGYYLLEDEENGHWMYVDRTLRIQVVRSWETPEKKKKEDKEQSFYCFTAEIWCDIAAGAFPMNVWSNPDDKGKDAKLIAAIAEENHLVYAVSADYYSYRVGQKHSTPSYKVGIELRDGEIRWDDPNPKPPGMPTYETLALFADGHVESAPSADRGAEDYKAAGAVHVYTFGPCLLQDGEFTDQVAKANRKLNPRHAFGMVEPGHYIDVVCEGRLSKKNGSTGVMMESLAQIMLDRGCKVAVNLDGGDTAVCSFMGKKLNLVVDSKTLKLNNGRPQVEALAFGVLERGE